MKSSMVHLPVSMIPRMVFGNTVASITIEYHSVGPTIEVLNDTLAGRNDTQPERYLVIVIPGIINTVQWSSMVYQTHLNTLNGNL